MSLSQGIASGATQIGATHSGSQRDATRSRALKSLGKKRLVRSAIRRADVWPVTKSYKPAPLRPRRSHKDDTLDGEPARNGRIALDFPRCWRRTRL